MTDRLDAPTSATKSLSQLFASFTRQQVLILGDVLLDEYITGDCSRLSPEAPVPVVAVGASRTMLGGAANTAANVASLGGRAVLIGLIGDDVAGRQLVELGEAAGIQLVPIRDGRPTSRKIRVVGQQQQLLRLDYEATGAVDGQSATAILQALRAHLATSAIIVISDYAKGFLNEDLCQQIIHDAHRAGKPVVIDPRPQHASFYRGCDYLTPNWKESLGLVGEPDTAATPDAVTRVGRHIATRFGSHVLLTLGAKGMVFFDRNGNRQREEPAIAREVFDVSGAGDTVVAALALAIAAGEDHGRAIALANRAAGVVVGKLGTATVWPDELLRHGDGEDRAVVARSELASLAARLRTRGQRIVTINGAFDLLHAGHLHILEEARRQGDALIVGVNADSTVRASKGAGRPYVTENDRARLLLALRVVDYVHIFPEPTPIAFLEQVRPDVHVNGAEYGPDCVEAPTVQAGGGRVHLVNRLPHLSTSDLGARIGARGPAADSPAPSAAARNTRSGVA